MLKTFSMTDIGMKRKFNQDYIYASEQPVGRLPNLFLVADGMGGHNAGDYASKHSVETIVREVIESTGEEPVGILRCAIESANRDLLRQSKENSKFSGMGTTLVAAVCTQDELLVANVGDSRLYIIGDTIRQITTDHSLVEEMVRVGGIDRNGARNHPDKNIITRAVGAGNTIDVDFFTVRLNEGDTVLMCSDGLTNMLDDEVIRGIVTGQTPGGGSNSLMEKAQELIKAANLSGGKDNIAVILIEPSARGE